MCRNIFLTLQLLLLVFILQGKALLAQDSTSNKYVFTLNKVLNATPVKNQQNTNTCWSFSVISFLESELLRTGKGEYNLSELFVVRHAFAEKAKRYIRMHGHMKFTDGGEPNDVADIIRKFGMVPEEIYPFSKVNAADYSVETHMKLKAYVNNIIYEDNILSPYWFNGFVEILDSSFGEIPDTFIINEKIRTPESYAEKLELVLDDYILITSFTHHPFYSEFILELPDNWSWGKAYNVPLYELIEIIDSSLCNNHTVVWATDITENGFDFRNGLAIVPEMNPEDINYIARLSRDSLSLNENPNPFKFPCIEKTITQEIRQEGFDNYTTTDDHSMHIIGTATDQNNTRYYYVKNSWGTDNFYKGYLFASEAYVKYKTIVIMVNKKALPEKIAKKLKTKYMDYGM